MSNKFEVIVPFFIKGILTDVVLEFKNGVYVCP